jgi:hypothetical protein
MNITRWTGSLDPPCVRHIWRRSLHHTETTPVLYALVGVIAGMRHMTVAADSLFIALVGVPGRKGQ